MIRVDDTVWVNENLIRDIEIHKGALRITIERDTYRVDPKYIISFCDLMLIDIGDELERSKN